MLKHDADAAGPFAGPGPTTDNFDSSSDACARIWYAVCVDLKCF